MKEVYVVREIILKNFPHLSIPRTYRYQNSENFWWCYHKTSVLGPPKFSAFISEKFDKTLICYTIVYLTFVICTFHIFILKWHIAHDILYLGTEKSIQHLFCTFRKIIFWTYVM